MGKGATINTPSMVCVEDYLDALKWTESEGGLSGLIKRSEANFSHIDSFVAKNDWASFLAKDEKTRSTTSVCLSLDLEADKLKNSLLFLRRRTWHSISGSTVTHPQAFASGAALPLRNPMSRSLPLGLNGRTTRWPKSGKDQGRTRSRSISLPCGAIRTCYTSR